MIKAYIYPFSARSSKDESWVYNPYRDNFIASVGHYVVFVNKNFPSSIGILNLAKYLSRINYLFLNWIEDLPDKKWGVFQSLFFLFFLRFKGLLGIKVVWTLHNKISHFGKNQLLKKTIFNDLLKRSDLVITHAKEGAVFAATLRPDISSKIFFFPHPIVPFNFDIDSTQKDYDFLVWGALSPYKGIEKFLKFLYENGLENKFKIRISGKAISSDFFLKLKTYQNKNIIIENVFLEHSELAKLIARSHCVLFTYSSESVLSSGVLIDSIAHKAVVLGPYIGAFKEMADMGIIKSYAQFDEIPKIFKKLKKNPNDINPAKIADFIEKHSWHQFAEALKPSLTN